MQRRYYTKSLEILENLKRNRLYIGICVLILTLGLNWLCKSSIWAYETLYLRGIFQFFRIIHDYTIGLLPIPSLYLIAPAFFYFFYRKQFRSIKFFLIATLTCLVWIVVFFYLLWGINYTQPQLKKVLELPPPNIDSIYIKTAFLEQTEIVSALAKSNITYPKLKEIEDEIRVHQEDILKDWNVPTVGRVRIRKLPAGSLLRIRTSGIYIPHAFEGHLDGGLYYKQHPFTMAHEMAHGYGYGDESVCNFIAYLTCTQSEMPALRYSAELAYWRYLVRYYAYHFPEEWQELRENLDPDLQADLEEIRKHISRYKNLMPVLRDVIYDKYLKSHGVSAGIKSYDQMIELIASYRAKNNLSQ